MAEEKRRGRPKGSKSKYTVTASALQQRRKNFRENFALIPAETDEEKQYNARRIEHIIRVQEIAQRADRHDLLSLKSCFIAYLKLCQEDGFKVGNLGAYTAMGMDAATFMYLGKKNDPETKEFVKFVRSTCAMFREALISDNELNPVVGIFWQRNFDGLRNDTEQVQALEETDDYSGSKAYKEKYRNLIDE